MNKTTNTIRTISEIGIIAALGFVFDELQGILFKGIFINGGSIGFAMIAVLIIAYRRGAFAAIVTGLIMGFLDLATSAYILHPFQLLLDYILPYAVVGLVGFLKPLYDKSDKKVEKILWLIAGAIIGGLLKFTSHYLAGIIYWADPENFAWHLNEMNPYLYCFVYNIAFIGPSIILTGGLLVAIECSAPRILTNKNVLQIKEEKSERKIPLILSIATTVAGLFLFVFFLIQYLLSFSDYKDGSAYGFDFDPDYMFAFVVGLLLIGLGCLSLYRTLKENFNLTKYISGFTLISLTMFIYALARLIRTYVKNKDHTVYWVWVIAATVIVLVSLALFIFLLIKDKEKKESNV